MIVYLALFSAVALFALYECCIFPEQEGAYKKNIQRRFFCYIVLALMIIVSGTRLVGGSDYYIYEQAYNSVPSLLDMQSWQSIYSIFWVNGFDIGYIFLMLLFKSFGINFHFFCLMMSAFFHMSLFKGLSKYCDSFSVVLLVFISKTYIYDTFISMRQSITIAIFFLSLQLIEDKKFVKYMLVCLICVLIHAGSIIMVPLYFLNRIHLTKRLFLKWIIIFLPFTLLTLFNYSINNIINPFLKIIFSLISDSWVMKVDKYVGNNVEFISPIYCVEFLIIVAIVLLYSNVFFDESLQNTKKELVIKLFLILWPLFTLFSGIGIITREKDYFILTYGCILSFVMQKQKMNNRVVLLLGCVMVSFYELMRYLIMFDGGALLEYRSWLIL